MDTNRIQHLISKIYTILSDKEKKTAIDIDLMLDYTRVMYADMLELKSKLANGDELLDIASIPHIEVAGERANSPVSAHSTDIGNTPVSSQSIVMEIPKTSNEETPAEPNIKEDSKMTVPNSHIATTISEGEVYNASDHTSVNLEAMHAVKEEHIELPLQVAVPVEKKEVRKLIGINDKYLFMNELFNNNKFDYESVLDFINQSQDLQTVDQWLNKEYVQNEKWNKEDATVDLFYGVVSKYFSNFK